MSSGESGCEQLTQFFSESCQFLMSPLMKPAMITKLSTKRFTAVKILFTRADSLTPKASSTVGTEEVSGDPSGSHAITHGTMEPLPCTPTSKQHNQDYSKEVWLLGQQSWQVH